MKIDKISVNGLFGHLNHEISLKDGGVTLLHGSNGCGKTTIFKLLQGIFTLNLEVLDEIKYDNCHIYFTNQTLLIEKRANISRHYVLDKSGRKSGQCLAESGGG